MLGRFKDLCPEVIEEQPPTSLMIDDSLLNSDIYIYIYEFIYIYMSYSCEFCSLCSGNSGVQEPCWKENHYLDPGEAETLRQIIEK